MLIFHGSSLLGRSEENHYHSSPFLASAVLHLVYESAIDNITLLNKVGIDKAAVVDAHELSGNDQAASVYLTNDTAQNLNWIDSGKFVEDENEGGKAYYVVRKVEIKHGVEIQKPVDFANTHPLTKTALSKKVKIDT